MSIRSMMFALVVGVVGVTGCVADEASPGDGVSAVSQSITGTTCRNKTGGGGAECDGKALILIPVHIDIIDDVNLSDIELEILEDSLNHVVNVGDIGTILSNNELKVFDVLNDFGLGVGLHDINVCANVLGGLLCK
jgi:hypothetical protein